MFCNSPRTDRLLNWVVKAERDMIVYQRRSPLKEHIAQLFAVRPLVSQ